MIKKTLSFITGYDALKRTGAYLQSSYQRGKSLKELVTASVETKKIEDRQAKYYVWSPFAGSYSSGEATIIVKNTNVISDFDRLPNAQHGQFFSGNNFKQLMTETFSKEQRERMYQDSRSTRIMMVLGLYFILLLSCVFLLLGNWYAVFSLPGAIYLIAVIIRKHVYEITLKELELFDLKAYFQRFGVRSFLSFKQYEVKQ